MKQECNSYITQYNTLYLQIKLCSIWYFIQFVCITIFMSLHVPAGACIPVASESPIHVPPVQVYLSIVVHTNIFTCDHFFAK